MSPLLLVCLLGVSLALPLAWGFRALPHEGWQIMATLPRVKQEGGAWSGVNLTYYGFILASAAVFGAAVFVFLLATIGIPSGIALVMLALVVAVTLPSAKLVALIVERKRHTFTVGGASFVGFLSAPMIVFAVAQAFHLGEPAALILPTLAAMSCAFLFGEGLGRLSCISFGCCWGRPIDTLGGRLRMIFNRFNVAYQGETKKICYEQGLEGIRVVPIQAITSTIYVASGLIGMALFLYERYALAFMLSVMISQGWRILSEVLRDDLGGVKISKYQMMGALTMAYCGLVYGILPAPELRSVTLFDGFAALWQPGVIVALQILWSILFLVTGWSMTTESTLRFRVRVDRVHHHHHAPKPARHGQDSPRAA